MYITGSILQAKAFAEGTAPISTALEFFGPYPETQTTGTSATFVANAVGDLLTSLAVQLTLNGSVVPDPTGTLRQTVADAIDPPLRGILSGVADPALKKLGTGLGEMDVAINSTNCPPQANDDSESTAEDTAVVVNVLGNDTDNEGTIDPTTVRVTSGPSHGSVSENPVTGAMTYTPAANYHGVDSFAYTVRDNEGAESCPATVTITVTPVNDPPVAVNDNYTTPEDMPLTIASPGVLANDTDPDDDNLTAILVSGPSHGTVTLNGDGSFTYTSAHNYTGPDSFTYRDNDGSADSNVATVSITVNPVIADLSLTMTVDRPTPNVGGDVVYTITVNNARPSATTNVAVSDVLPAGMSFESATASQGAYSAETGVWTIGTMASGASVTLQITRTVLTSGSRMNTAEVTASDASDPDSTPNNHNPAEDDQARVVVTPQLAAARVTHTNTTCHDYLNGAGTDLTPLQYGVRNGTINSVAPGVFFYYVQVQATASSFSIVIDQSENHPTFSTLFGVLNSQVQLYNPDCTLSGLGTVSIANGDVTINVSGATVGQVFIVQVKYDPSPVVGQLAPDPSTVNYLFTTKVNGTVVSEDGVALAKKAT